MAHNNSIKLDHGAFLLNKQKIKPYLELLYLELLYVHRISLQ